MIKSIGVLPEESLEDCLVITAQANGVPTHKANCEKIEYAARIGPAIDIVAEIDLDNVLDGPAAGIVIDARDGLRQQVRASMNIAHGVDARVRRHGGVDRSRIMVGSAGSHCQEVWS